MTAPTAPKPTATGLAESVHASLVKLAEISDRLDLHPVGVHLSANTYGGQRIAVQFTQGDRASVDKLGDEVGVPVVDYSPTLYDRKGLVDGIEWGTYCGVTVDEDTVEVTA